MSILGYSSAYFLPEYWSNTPLYGEKIIPLLDYVLSTDFEQADKLANAFYAIQDKYKNTANLPIWAIEEIINESGYTYVKDLLGNDEDSIRLLTYLLVLINQLKGTQMGIEVVLNLLKKDTNPMVMEIVGDPEIYNKEVSNFSKEDYVLYNGFTTDNEPFELTFQVRTTDFTQDQCIASSSGFGFRLMINTGGKLILSLGNDGRSWNILDSKVSTNILLPNTNYFIKLTFDGYEYTLAVSTDDKKYSNFISFSSMDPLRMRSGVIYIGVDRSSGTAETPFRGYINLTPFSVSVENINIQEWFEQTPVGEENTFLIKAELDIGLVSSDFFSKFAQFVKRYVYPSLAAFDAKLNFESNLTFLPYIRQKVTYVASADLLTFSQFMSRSEDDMDIWEDFYVLSEDGESYEAFHSLEDNKLKFNIIPVPSTAKVEINGEEISSIDVEYNDKITYKVSKDGYETVEETIYVTSSEDLVVRLTPSQN